MNLRGWISLAGLGLVMTGCAQTAATTATPAATQPTAKQVAQALLSGERVQALNGTQAVRFDAATSKVRIYQALGAERSEGTYQALKAVLAK